MEKLVTVMMQIIKSEICNSAVNGLSESVLSDSFYEKLYSLSKSHDIVHIVGSYLKKNSLLPEGELGMKFSKQILAAVYRYQLIQSTNALVCDRLSAEGIAHMALKGSVIREYYPEPWMRTSCDIDVLVHENELDRAVEVLCGGLNFVAESEKQFHDISLRSPKGVHLELHFNILENMDSLDTVLSRVWDHSVKGENDFSYRQTNEFLMFHLVAHCAYHFVNGGCGIRPFIDLYILKNKMPYDESAVKALCKECGIERFYDKMLALADVWFGEGEHDGVTAEMEKYLLAGGVYGTKEQKLAVDREKKGGKAKYLLQRVFMPYSALKTQYPVLEKHKWLMPICQIRRWFRMLFSGNFRRSARELKIVNGTDTAKARSISSLMNALGL